MFQIEDERSVLITATEYRGIGQKVHFGKKCHAKAELRNHLVLGTPGGFDMFFTLWGGVGMRF